MSYDMHAQPPTAMTCSVSAYQRGIGATATGRDVNLPGCATHWREIGPGSIIFVPGVGEFVVDDAAGPKVPSHGVDLRHWDNKQDCLQWGRKWMTCRIRFAGRAHDEPVSRAKEARQDGVYEIQHTATAPKQIVARTTMGQGEFHQAARTINGQQISSVREPVDSQQDSNTGLAHSALLGAILGLAVGGGVIVGIMKGILG